VSVLFCLAAPLRVDHVAHTGPNDNRITDKVMIDGQETRCRRTGRHTNKPGAAGLHGRYLLGADQTGRDVMVRPMCGGRTSIYIGLATAAVTTVLAAGEGVRRSRRRTGKGPLRIIGICRLGRSRRALPRSPRGSLDPCLPDRGMIGSSIHCQQPCCCSRPQRIRSARSNNLRTIRSARKNTITSNSPSRSESQSPSCGRSNGDVDPADTSKS
jgi:hypothetical protein